VFACREPSTFTAETRSVNNPQLAEDLRVLCQLSDRSVDAAPRVTIRHAGQAGRDVIAARLPFRQRKICGGGYRMFPTANRFDVIYSILFKATRKDIRNDWPHISR